MAHIIITYNGIEHAATGGRLIATSHGPAAMFMYDDDRGERLVVLTRPMISDRNAPMAPHSGSDVSGFACLVGQATAEAVKPIADEVRRQAQHLEFRRLGIGNEDGRPDDQGCGHE